MQQTGEMAVLSGSERRRVEAVVETLATLRSQGESLAEVAHDARNMVTALGLYCDLLEEPGVLSVPFAHYGNELRLVAAASRRLVEKLVALDGLDCSADGSVGVGTPEREEWAAGPGFGEKRLTSSPGSIRGVESSRELNPGFSLDERVGWVMDRHSNRSRHWEFMASEPIGNLAAELLANRNLLAALVGPGIAVTVDVEGGAKAVGMTAEDLTRVLVNLVKNAAEAMPSGGRILIGLSERRAEAGVREGLLLTVEDNGPGIAPEALEKIFESGFTTRARTFPEAGGWASTHRGLGLTITRSLVEASGGRILASNRAPGRTDSGHRKSGVCFEIELPVRTV